MEQQPDIERKTFLATLSDVWKGVHLRASAIMKVRPEPSNDSLLIQIKSISSWSWFGSVVFFAFVLSYLSKYVSYLALKPVVAPVTIFAMALIGDFDISRAMLAVAEKAGTALVVIGLLGIFLTVQNLYKGALFLQSLHPDYKRFRNHAVASILTPITTVGILYTFMYFGFFLKFSTLIFSVLALTLADSAASTLVYMQEILQSEVIDVAKLQKISEHVGMALRIAIIVVLGVYIAFVVTTYLLMYKVLLYTLEQGKAIITSLVIQHLPSVNRLFLKALVFERNNRKTVWETIALCSAIMFIVLLMVGVVVSGNLSQTSVRNVQCSHGSTTAILKGIRLVLVAEDGTGKCFGDQETNLHAYGEYIIDGNAYYRLATPQEKEFTLKDRRDKEYTYKRMIDTHVPGYFWMYTPSDWEKNGVTSTAVKKAVESHKRRNALMEPKTSQIK